MLLTSSLPLWSGLRRCIPIRYPGAAPTPETTEVMLITSRGGGWVFPKVRAAVSRLLGARKHFAWAVATAVRAHAQHRSSSSIGGMCLC